MPITVDTAFLDTMPANVAVQFFDRVAASPDSEAFRFPRGEAWESVTWKQAGDKVEALAAGLIALGVEPEQRVGIASGTRYEWILADLLPGDGLPRLPTREAEGLGVRRPGDAVEELDGHIGRHRVEEGRVDRGRHLLPTHSSERGAAAPHSGGCC